MPHALFELRPQAGGRLDRLPHLRGTGGGWGGRAGDGDGRRLPDGPDPRHAGRRVRDHRGAGPGRDGHRLPGPGNRLSTGKWRSRCCRSPSRSTREFVERFQREARTAAQLEHPNIIPIYRVGQTGQVIFFVMKLVRGGSLSTLLEGAGRLPPDEIRRILVESGKALGYAHRHGDRPPRHQARQHHVRRARRLRAHRLRDREGGERAAAHRHRACRSGRRTT